MKWRVWGKEFVWLKGSLWLPPARENSHQGFFFASKMLWVWSRSETARIRFWRARFQTASSVSFLALAEFRGENLSEFLSSYYVCANTELTEFFHKTHRVSSLFQNSTLETVSGPFPSKPWCLGSPWFAPWIPVVFILPWFAWLLRLRKRKHTPPCSSAELFFAERKWGLQRKDFGGRYGFPGFNRIFVSFLESFSFRPEKFPKRFSFGGGRVRLSLLCYESSTQLLVCSSPSFSSFSWFPSLWWRATRMQTIPIRFGKP